MAALTAPEVRQLTLFKWVYTLRRQGFTPVEARRLLFWKWQAQARPQRVR